MAGAAWTDARLDRLRREADGPVDSLVHSYYARHPEITDARELVVRIARRSAADDDPEVAAYVADTTALPPWADVDLIAAGQRFFADYSSEIGNILFCASLPEAYGAAHGVHVLTVTKELLWHTERRAAETGRFLLDALTEGSLAPGAKGYQAARGVRLMHAAVRHMVKHDADVRRDTDPAVEDRACPAYTPRWSSAWGEPINQEDLLGTLLTFTWRVFDVLDNIALSPTPDEKRAYLHTWCVIGHLLGIKPELLPIEVNEANALHRLTWRRLQGPSCAGRQMTAALLETLHARMPGPDSLPESEIRAFLGARAARRLNVPRSGWPAALFGPMRMLHRIERGSGMPRLTRPLLAGLRRKVWERFISDGTGERPPFELPPVMKIPAP
jgi:hypothetical protein